VISPQIDLVTKKRSANGFKGKRATSDKPKTKEKHLLTKPMKGKKMMTKSNKSKVSHQLLSAKSDIDSSKHHVVLFDID
jgi:hypothetical protein